MTWLLLVSAIAAEVTGTIALRFSEGFTRLVPSLVAVAGYGAAFWLLAQVLSRGMNIGVAYGVWAALGVSLVAAIGALFLGDGLTWIQAGGVVLVIGGVLALEMGGAH
ncbi:DMT family transporter [Streptomonospora salina]|uniref:Small multidrug resistance pump n=1 Tax=Streptomonospora salina TaxID=104205 RepID=A0A841DZH3_9ACTN|nr:SMR family transporter [Streptomonospora salina]MBB5996877.1 small multidrug resistance pump [Streptomonospora salina]